MWKTLNRIEKQCNGNEQSGQDVAKSFVWVVLSSAVRPQYSECRALTTPAERELRTQSGEATRQHFSHINIYIPLIESTWFGSGSQANTPDKPALAVEIAQHRQPAIHLDSAKEINNWKRTRIEIAMGKWKNSQITIE